MFVSFSSIDSSSCFFSSVELGTFAVILRLSMFVSRMTRSRSICSNQCLHLVSRIAGLVDASPSSVFLSFLFVIGFVGNRNGRGRIVVGGGEGHLNFDLAGCLFHRFKISVIVWGIGSGTIVVRGRNRFLLQFGGGGGGSWVI